MSVGLGDVKKSRLAGGFCAAGEQSFLNLQVTRITTYSVQLQNVNYCFR